MGGRGQNPNNKQTNRQNGGGWVKNPNRQTKKTQNTEQTWADAVGDCYRGHPGTHRVPSPRHLPPPVEKGQGWSPEAPTSCKGGLSAFLQQFCQLSSARAFQPSWGTPHPP